MILLAIFGIDIGDLVADLLRALLDLLVPDFTADWGSALATWLVALPNVTDGRQFAQLNAFRRDLTHAAWGLLSLSFVVGGLQYWAAGFMESGRASAVDAVRRAAIAAGALAVYPTLIAQLLLAVNHLTAAVIRNPRVVDGLDLALGAAFALGAVSGGLSLGLALAAVIAAVFFLAALLVMKVALTAMLCVLVVSGALVIALYPMPVGDGLTRMWAAGLACAVVVPVAWALIFAVAGLVSADALAWSGGLGEGLGAVVKPFVAVACLYLAYRAPALLVAQARMLGLRVDMAAGRSRGSPGEGRLRAVASRQGGAYRDRFAGLAAQAARPGAAGMARVGGMAARQTGAVGRTARRVAARGAVSLASAAGANERRGERVVAGVSAAAGAAGAAKRAGRAARHAADWWRRPGASGHARPGRDGSGRGVDGGVRRPPTRSGARPSQGPGAPSVPGFAARRIVVRRPPRMSANSTTASDGRSAASRPAAPPTGSSGRGERPDRSGGSGDRGR